MAGELRSQGTEVFVVNPTDTGKEIIKVANVTNIGEYGYQAGDLITTNLDSRAVEKLSALPDGGDLSLTVNVKAGDAGHEWLEANAGTAPRYQVIIGYSDGTAPPTYTGSAPVIPTTRTFRSFNASLKSFRIQGVSPDSVISAAVTFGVSGEIIPSYKAP